MDYFLLAFVAIMIAIAVVVGMMMIKTETIGTIVVVINDPDGKPAAGVEVTLKDANGQVVASGFSGDDGTVIFVNLQLNAEYVVEAHTKEGFLSEKIYPKRDGGSFVLTMKKLGEGSAEGDRPNL